MSSFVKFLNAMLHPCIIRGTGFSFDNFNTMPVAGLAMAVVVVLGSAGSVPVVVLAHVAVAVVVAAVVRLGSAGSVPVVVLAVVVVGCAEVWQ